jgi:hypothetical protein
VICFIMHWPDGSGMDGCPHDAQSRRDMQPTLIGWHGVRLVFGAVPSGTTSAIVHFQDGSQRALTPRARLVAITIPKKNQTAGRRPMSVLLRTTGRDTATIKLPWRFPQS